MEQGDVIMKRVVGFALFFIAAGILLGMLLPNKFIEVLVVVGCILGGYHLFYC